MKYEKGDHVKVRKDLVKGEYYNRLYFANDMSRYCGEVVEIQDIRDGNYVIKGDWELNDAMIEENTLDDVLLTKREKIAAMAMEGLLANSFDYETDEIAKYAVKLADALIQELNK